MKSRDGSWRDISRNKRGQSRIFSFLKFDLQPFRYKHNSISAGTPISGPANQRPIRLEWRKSGAVSWRQKVSPTQILICRRWIVSVGSEEIRKSSSIKLTTHCVCVSWNLLRRNWSSRVSDSWVSWTKNTTNDCLSLDRPLPASIHCPSRPLHPKWTTNRV